MIILITLIILDVQYGLFRKNLPNEKCENTNSCGKGLICQSESCQVPTTQQALIDPPIQQALIDPPTPVALPEVCDMEMCNQAMNGLIRSGESFDSTNLPECQFCSQRSFVIPSSGNKNGFLEDCGQNCERYLRLTESNYNSDDLNSSSFSYNFEKKANSGADVGHTELARFNMSSADLPKCQKLCQLWNKCDVAETYDNGADSLCTLYQNMGDKQTTYDYNNFNYYLKKSKDQTTIDSNNYKLIDDYDIFMNMAYEPNPDDNTLLYNANGRIDLDGMTPSQVGLFCSSIEQCSGFTYDLVNKTFKLHPFDSKKVAKEGNVLLVKKRK